MLRSMLLALALAAPVVAAGPACAPHVAAELELGRPLRLMPVNDPGRALAAVAAALRDDPHAGLEVDEYIVEATAHGPPRPEVLVAGPEKQLLKDFIGAHPELAPPGGYRFGYAREVGPEGRPRWRLHCLGEHGMELRRVASAAVVEDEEGDGWRIRVRLGSEDAAAFGRLTMKHLGARIAIVQDDEVLMAPLVHEPLLTGVFDLTGGDNTREGAEASLRRLLGP